MEAISAIRALTLGDALGKLSPRLADATTPILRRLPFLAVVGAAVAGVALIVAHSCRLKRRRERLQRLTGSVVVVTGASSGIGLEVARNLALQVGVRKVILIARGEHTLARTVHSLNEAAQRDVASAFAADGSDGIAVDSCVAKILAEHGKIDVLINCAGAGRYIELWNMPRREVAAALEAPLMAACYFTRAVLSRMVADDAGTVIMVQSPASRTPFPGSTMYSTTRWALRGLTESLRADLHDTNVKVQECILGETTSNYFVANPGSIERLPGISILFPRLTPVAAGAAVVETILNGKAAHAYPAILDATLHFYTHFPELVQSLVNASGWSSKIVRRAVIAT